MRQIYIHGLGQTPDAWEKVVKELKVAECSLCPNLAELVGGKVVTYDNLYTAFSVMCDTIDEPLGLCGLSLGGVLALHYAIDHPEKVQALVLIAAQYKMPKKLLRLQNLLFRFMPGTLFRQMGFGKTEFLRLCQTMMELDFSESLYKITCPTVVICGEKDQANRPASMELAGLVTHSELIMISGCGHEVNKEAPVALAGVLRRAMEKVDAGLC